MSQGSRLPGFHEKSLDARAVVLSEYIQDKTLRSLLGGQSLGIEIAERLSENVVAVFGLPLSIATNFRVNGEDVLVPMSVEEPSVVAAASFGAKLVREGGGFVASADEPIMIGQIELRGIPNLETAEARILSEKERLLETANALHPRLVARGGGVVGLRLRVLEAKEGHAVCEILIKCQDAMGANLINTTCEALATPLSQLTGGSAGLKILSNYCDLRRARSRAEIPKTSLGPGVAEAIALASRFAERDVWRAVTHNKGFMNGVDSVVVATGNDFRAVEAAAHAFAIKEGVYRPLARWWTTEHHLVGEAEIPLSLGTVGGATEAHPGARLALEILGRPSAKRLSEITVSVGLAQNLSALRALSTEGIQKGHMALHQRRLTQSTPFTETQFAQWLLPKVVQIDEALRSFFESKKSITHTTPELLPAHKALEEFTLRGGKRLRASLALLGFEASAREPERAALEASLSLELLQSAILIQEDLIEGEQLRRGALTIHRALAQDQEERGQGLAKGEALALLVSNLAQSYCFDLLLSSPLPQERRIAASQEILSWMREVFAGKWRDLRLNVNEASLDDVQRAYELRGGRYNCAGPLCFGASLAGSSRQVTQALESFGTPVGIAFQIQDELLSLFGKQEETGKSAGAEVKTSHPRILLFEGLHRCEGEEAQRLKGLLQKKVMTVEERESLKDLLQKSGAKDAAYERALALINEAKDSLKDAPFSERHKTLFADLADFVISRSS